MAAVVIGIRLATQGPRKGNACRISGRFESRPPAVSRRGTDWGDAIACPEAFGLAATAFRTTSASDRRSEKAIARSASCCSASIAANRTTGAVSFFSPIRTPRRGAPVLVARSVLIADLLFANDQVLGLDHQIVEDVPTGLWPAPRTCRGNRMGSGRSPRSLGFPDCLKCLELRSPARSARRSAAHPPCSPGSPVTCARRRSGCCLAARPRSRRSR